MRLFVGLPLPDDVAMFLEFVRGGIHGARWEDRDKLHLTLRYIGEVDGGMNKRVAQALAAVDADAFTMEVAGVGHFPPRGKPRSIWAGIADATHATRLHGEIDRALGRIGLEPDSRNFAPHITLARLRDSPAHEVADFLVRHALLRQPPFVVDRFLLYSSIRTPSGSKYRVERAYPLCTP